MLNEFVNSFITGLSIITAQKNLKEKFAVKNFVKSFDKENLPNQVKITETQAEIVPVSVDVVEPIDIKKELSHEFFGETRFFDFPTFESKSNFVSTVETMPLPNAISTIKIQNALVQTDFINNPNLGIF